MHQQLLNIQENGNEERDKVICDCIEVRSLTNEQRLEFIPLLSELVYVPETHTMYVGDGETWGGLEISEKTTTICPIVIHQKEPHWLRKFWNKLCEEFWSQTPFYVMFALEVLWIVCFIILVYMGVQQNAFPIKP